MPAPRGLVQRFDEHLHRSGLLTAGARLLVAVSGGADSVALLRLLGAVNRSNHWGFDIVAGHVDHRTRGKESAGDAAFVKKLAKDLGVNFMVRTLAGAGKRSEAELREGRLTALAAMATAARCDSVVLAHQADDQAETVLMRIVRGTALHGLGGIAPVREIGAKLVRPLLPFSGGELRAHLRKIGQAWREDASNASRDYLRNRIRHDLLPLLERLQPRAKQALVRLAERAQESQELLETLAARLAEKAFLRLAAKEARLERAALRDEPLPVIGELFRDVVGSIGGSLNALTAERIAAAIRVAVAEAGGKVVQLGGGVTMEVKGPLVRFVRAARERKRP